MARKRSTQNETTQNQPELVASENILEATTPEEENEEQHTEANIEEAEPANITDENPDTDYQLLFEGQADKLSPRSPGKIHFQLAKQIETGSNVLRLIRNEGGGLHTKEWIDLQQVIDTIAAQEDRPWKSALLKTTIKGRSSNNSSLLAACLRCPELGLTKQSDKSLFLHVLTDDFEEKAKALIART